MNETFNAWTLVSLSPLPLWLRVTLSVLVAAGALAVAWSYRGARRRAWLIATRMLGALLVLGFLLEPALQLRAVRKQKSRLAFVVDRSASMTLPTPDGPSRYDALLGFVRNNKVALDALGSSHVLEWFDLDGAPLGETRLLQPPDGQRTDLVTALERARDAASGKPLAGLVLLSDGADNAELEGDSPGSLHARALERLERLGAPVSVVATSRASAFADLAILDVVGDEFAFVHNTLEVEVVVQAVGMDAASVPVTLRRGEEVIATQETRLAPGKPARVTFKLKPDRIGQFVYSASVPVLTDEALTANNERSFVLQVIRDKIRVLQVAGRPSWDERFLRQHLKENPNVDLISFFILRTPSDQPMAPESELSLIPFPVERLFTTELPSFDIVIFQNFDYRPYNMARYLPNIRAAVRGGLGFAMIGGEQSFGGGGYAGTELEPIIPLALGEAGIATSVVAPTLTEAGRTHPVTDLSRAGGSNERYWAALPPWATFNRTAGLAPGATALATHPSVRGPAGAPLPLIAVMEVDQGRAMAIATESMWSWRLSSARDGGASQRAYNRFWSNALRWLVRDPEHSRVQVLPAHRHVDVGAEAEVSFSVRGTDYRPVPFAKLTVQLEGPNGAAARTDELVAGEAGVVRHSYGGLGPGAYRVVARSRDGTQDLGEGQGVFVVEARSRELTNAAPRPDLLAALAEATSGNTLAPDANLADGLELVDPEAVEIDRRRNVELWDNAWALAAGLVLLAADWALRRRSGYL